MLGKKPLAIGKADPCSLKDLVVFLIWKKPVQNLEDSVDCGEYIRLCPPERGKSEAGKLEL